MNYGANSEKIQEQIDNLFSSILKEQQKINAVKQADPDKADLTKKMLEDFSKIRGKGFFFDYISSGKGHGPFSMLVDGSVKYDLINGIGVNLLGHSHPLFIKSCLESATTDTIMCGNLLPYPEAFALTDRLIDSVKKSRLKYFWFAGSGSFANDTALKMIWQKTAPKYRLIAFEKAFAGRSVATQNITYNSEYRVGMPPSIDVDHVPNFDISDPENSLTKTISALDKLWEENPDSYCAIVIELIQGEAGFIYGPREYYEAIFKWAKSKGIYIWVDEVQTFGRTRELFAFQMFELDEYVDIVTIAKVLQTGGTLFTEELNPKPGLIAGTFNGSIVSLNAGEKIIRYLLEGNFYGENGRIKELEDIFKNNLKRLSDTTCKGKIGYIGGIGTMISFEVGDASSDLTKKFVKEFFKNGVISFSAGKDPSRVRFLLPLSITTEHIDEIFSILEKTVNDVI